MTHPLARQALATRYFPPGSIRVTDRNSDALAVVYSGPKGEPMAIGYHGKANKPDWWFRFRSPERREAKIKEFFAGRQAQLGYKAEQRQQQAERRAKPHKLQVGHVLVASWGYDQTNIDYFQVVELVGKRSVKTRSIGSIDASTGREGWAQGKSVPALDAFRGEPELHRVNDRGDGVKIDEVRRAYLWDGKPESWTAYA